MRAIRFVMEYIGWLAVFFWIAGTFDLLDVYLKIGPHHD